MQGNHRSPVLCCDNQPHNGSLVGGLVRDFAALRSDRLAAWIEATTAFPATMVDRIVPAATDADLADAMRLTGLSDAAPISHEPFRQWVIEDRFVDGVRPHWEKVGAELVTDVRPYEHMKLRLLNGAHSALAYLGYLAGHETIADTVADPMLRRYVTALWQEIIPVVPPPPGVDLANYTTQLLTRFANPAIRHRTWQIAMDGSQKLPQRLLSTIRERLAHGLPIPRLALAIAAWIHYVGGIDEAGRPIGVRDPIAGVLATALAHAGSDPARRVQTVLQQQSVFGTDLPRSAQFVSAVTNFIPRCWRAARAPWPRADQPEVPMEQSWRWFGPDDVVKLPTIRQAGASGVVTALHQIPYGEVWTVEAIEERKSAIAADPSLGLHWNVVESLPVHERIKLGEGDLSALFDAYRQSMRNLAACGIRIICYNFMPVVDWNSYRVVLCAAGWRSSAPLQRA